MSSRNFLLEVLIQAKDQAGKTFDNLKKRVKGLFSSFTELASALGSVERKFRVAQKVFDEVITKTIEHTRSNYELSLTMGATVEEASRLKEVAEDSKISIETLGTAMALARKNGFDPSIESLAQISDEFLSLNDKEAQANLLNSTFGRGWKALLPLLVQGGDAIRDQAKAIDENLIVTGEMVRQEESYRLALDSVSDAIDAQKYKLGNELLPLLNQMLIPAQKEVVNGQTFMVRTIAGVTQAMVFQNQTLVDATTEYNNLKAAMVQVDLAVKDADLIPQGLVDLPGLADEAEAGLKKVTLAIGEMTSAKLADEAITALNQAYQDGTISGDEYEEQMKLVASELQGIPAEQINASLALFRIKQDLDAGGISALDFSNYVIQLDRTLRGLPRDIKIKINVTTTGNGAGMVGGIEEEEHGRAVGGPVEEGQPYVVGEKGAEIFIPDEDGQIIPHDVAFGTKKARGVDRIVEDRQTRMQPGAQSSNMVSLYVGEINIFPPEGADAEDVAELVVAKLSQALGSGNSMIYAE